MRLAARVAPGSALDGAAHRTLMAGALPRIAFRGDGASRALARALATTALGRVPPEEREWIARIEAHREQLYSREEIPPPAFYPGPPVPGRWAAWWVSVSPVWGLFLMRLVRELSPLSCVELGTGFGISAAYQAASLELNGRGKLITLDAAADWAEIAEEGLSTLQLRRVEVRVGDLSDTLEEALAQAAPVDYVLMDAEHKSAATIHHFESLLPYLSNEAVVVLDDVAFDKDMMRAWTEIKRHARVSRSLDLWRMGVTLISQP